MLATVALAAIRTQVLPRWLGYSAGLTAVALVVNGSYNLYGNSGSNSHLLAVPARTIVVGVILFRRTSRQEAHVARARTTTRLTQPSTLRATSTVSRSTIRSETRGTTVVAPRARTSAPGRSVR
jgi:hypothetical protein